MSEEKIISQKRFIAGAVCVQCKKADKIVTYTVETNACGDTDEVMACVSCGHKQLKSQLVMPASRQVLNPDASPVKFVTPDKQK